MNILTLLGTKVAINTLSKPLKLLNFFKYILGLGVIVSLFFMILSSITLTMGDAAVSNNVINWFIDLFNWDATVSAAETFNVSNVTNVILISAGSVFTCMILQVAIQHFATLNSKISLKKENKILYKVAKYELESVKKNNAKVTAKGISRLDKKVAKHSLKKTKTVLKQTKKASKSREKMLKPKNKMFKSKKK